MARLEPFVVLARATAERRITPEEFSAVCLPLYKSFGGPYPSKEQFDLATELFYVAHDRYTGSGPMLPGLLDDDAVVLKAQDLYARMRDALGEAGTR
jgi:hypothetical protein